MADFITDKHQKCVLHRQRAKRLRPLIEEIDKDEFLDAYKTLHLDVGNAFKVGDELLGDVLPACNNQGEK